MNNYTKLYELCHVSCESDLSKNQFVSLLTSQPFIITDLNSKILFKNTEFLFRFDSYDKIYSWSSLLTNCHSQDGDPYFFSKKLLCYFENNMTFSFYGVSEVYNVRVFPFEKKDGSFFLIIFEDLDSKQTKVSECL
jgi:hypothetical protein